MELAELRTNLCIAVKDACLGKASSLAGSDVIASPSSIAGVIGDFANWLTSEATPAADATLILQHGPFAPGASRLAGLPDMPPAMEWPRHHGNPLAFLAQVDLSALPAGIQWPVPKRGWLYLFLGTNMNGIHVGNTDDPAHRVLYFDGDVSELRTRSAPEGLEIPNEMAYAEPYAISFTRFECAAGQFWG